MDQLSSLLPGQHLLAIPLLPIAPTDIISLELMGASLRETEVAES
jgi:hypothetical protein